MKSGTPKKAPKVAKPSKKKPNYMKESDEGKKNIIKKKK